MTVPQRISPSGKKKMITRTVTFDPALVDTLSASDQSVTVPGCGVGDAILASPRGVFADGLLLGPNRCAVAGTALVRFANPTAASVNAVSQGFGFLLIKKNGKLRASPSGPLKILFADITIEIGSLADAAATDLSFAVPQAKVGDFILITPLGTLTAGLGMGPHRCLVDGTVLMRSGNATVGSLALASQQARVCLIRPSRTDRGSPSGPNGIIERTVNVDVASQVARTATDTSVLVPGVEPGDSIIATPLGTWPDGLALGPHRCLAAGTVLMRVFNGTAGAVDPAAQDIRFTIIKRLGT